MTLVNNSFNIFVNVFLHYPEVYNSSTISRRIREYFTQFFLENKLEKSKFGGEVFVNIKSAPHNENQLIIVDFDFLNEIDETLNDKNNLLKWENYLFIYFDKQIKEIKFRFKK